jgi:SpoVK/Ycf46/Vps4 family AAA+-type ATPase
MENVKMKIVKKNDLLLEAAENEIKDPEEVLSELNVKKVDKELDLDSATDEEILADIATGAKDANVAIDVEGAEDVAETVEEVAKLIVNPYGTAQPQKLKKILQRSLNTALRKKSIGDSKNFPNVLIYGLAGFGKTSIVKEFCEEHNIYLFECDAKSLDQATVGGIPYPTQDPRTGEYTQAPIASSY